MFVFLIGKNTKVSVQPKLNLCQSLASHVFDHLECFVHVVEVEGDQVLKESYCRCVTLICYISGDEGASFLEKNPNSDCDVTCGHNIMTSCYIEGLSKSLPIHAMTSYM